MQDYDVIVIGSGAGGLAGAVSLAQAGQKVLVLEQHDVPGGWCHSFTLGGHRFSPGVHYIGELGEGGMMRAIYEGLGVADDVPFFELNPDGYDHVVVGDERFDIPKGKQAYVDRLTARFPQEASGIRSYIDTVQGLSDALRAPMKIKGVADALMTPWRMRTMLTSGMISLDRLLRRHVKDDLLRTILAMQCGDHGLPPSRAPAALHAAIAGHYFEGAYFPKGGGFRIPRAFVRALKRAGGEIRLKTAVQQIMVERQGSRRRAIGVRLEDGTEIRADTVLSNADPDVTYRRLLDPENLSRRLQRRLDRTRYSVSALSLFFAVDMDLEAMGLDSGNYWYAARPDLERVYSTVGDLEGLASNPPEGLFLTATTLKDPTKRKGRTHTLEAFQFVSNQAFGQWQDTKMGARPEEYRRLKDRLTDQMFTAVERIIPGVRGHVTFSDLGTPVTNRHYVMATQGSLYGTEKTLRNVGPFAYGVKSEIQGLYLCGASTVGHGVMGATMSGIEATRQILGIRMRDILQDTGQTLQVYPSDDPSQWPDTFRRGQTAEDTHEPAAPDVERTHAA